MCVCVCLCVCVCVCVCVFVLQVCVGHLDPMFMLHLCALSGGEYAISKFLKVPVTTTETHQLYGCFE